MRKLILGIALLAIISATIAYILYRRSKPLPTAVGWKAHVTTLAGDGSPRFRDSQPSTQAAFSDPFGVAVADDGTIYVSDAGESNRIRKIAPDRTVTTFAGSNEGFSDGLTTAASFNTPSGLAL